MQNPFSLTMNLSIPLGEVMSYCHQCGREELNGFCTCLRRNPVTKGEALILYGVLLIFPQVFMILLRQTSLNQDFVVSLSLALILFVATVLDALMHRNYLALFFGCHQRTERSLKILNKLLPLCARCTGIYVGIFIGLINQYFNWFPWYVSILLGVPLLIDGILQKKKKYTSNNFRRMVTGLLFAQFVLFAFSKYQIIIYDLIWRLIIYLHI